MKKLLTLLMVAVMLVTMSFAALAAPTTLDGLMADVTLPSRPAPWEQTIDVPVDIKVDIGSGYVDGPIDQTYTDAGVTADYQATIYMQSVRDTYSFYVNTLGGLISTTPEIAGLQAELDACVITGGFTIEITYPKTAVLPDAILGGSALDGFSIKGGPLFEETSRAFTSVDSTTNKLTINVAVKSGILAENMTPNLNDWLPNITLTKTGITLNSIGENKVVGTITGCTTITDQHGTKLIDIYYNGKQGTDSGITGTEISEIVNLTTGGGGDIGGGGIHVTPPSSVGDKDEIEVTIEIPNAENPESIVIPGDEKNPTINIDEIIEEVKPEREGFEFAGFYDDEYYSNKLEGEIEVSEDTTIYARFVNTTIPEIFDGENHIQYIHGYPDETVRPESNVSREEIATMFYRLLKEEVREELKTDVNDFSDVEADRWSNNAVSTMANGGYINGYPDGSFRPEDYITRAELATMAYRFIGAVVEGERNFNDIDGHWAEENIKSIANNEWILGYKDGSFRPDEYITRAEAITIINRIVVRYANEHGLVGDEKQWIDNPADAWYYYAIIEATHEHDHVRAEDKYNEIWSKSDSEMLVD